MNKYKLAGRYIQLAWCALVGKNKSNITNFAEREFSFINEHPDIVFDVYHLLDVFASQHHSGSSAPFCINYFNKLGMFKPLTPLTGNDDEWTEVSESLYQNKRYSSIFKTKNEVYDINGIVFEDQNGIRFTSSKCRVPVTFPYTPSTYIQKITCDKDNNEVYLEPIHPSLM